MNHKYPSIEDLLHSFLEGEAADAPERHYAKTEDCITMRKFDMHVRADAFLNRFELDHVNQCPDYCQPALQAFLKLSGKTPQVAAYKKLEKLAAQTQRGSGFAYPAVVQRETGNDVGLGRVVVTEGPFLAGDQKYLVIGLRIAEPDYLAEMTPVRMHISSTVPNGASIVTVDLPGTSNQLLKIRLPRVLLDIPEWRAIETSRLLPVSFLLCPLGGMRLLGLTKDMRSHRPHFVNS